MRVLLPRVARGEHACPRDANACAATSHLVLFPALTARRHRFSIRFCDSAAAVRSYGLCPRYAAGLRTRRVGRVWRMRRAGAVATVAALRSTPRARKPLCSVLRARGGAPLSSGHRSGLQRCRARLDTRCVGSHVAALAEGGGSYNCPTVLPEPPRRLCLRGAASGSGADGRAAAHG